MERGRALACGAAAVFGGWGLQAQSAQMAANATSRALRIIERLVGAAVRRRER